ncbi:aminoglycoside phosphotransferase family protein [Amycolatopsis sp. DG1A-15b]|uniref:aminoglycoside phosphotransferase family protein n=1 Tax=Amycolatopsis sp. DG1A-15b TaxID=3052846 RepID=UPI00255B945B|nr:aminoglycoside phosphotransferase family protein [Amycolatopsis sp. DG1A-15b]WIX88759.1 aminoglycoside phosphotransferase family protein [Amycolatopsis sp. DG1A-15b]
MTAEEVLQDRPHRRVVRIGDTVRRPTFPWSPAVHALLRHLEAVGFRWAPRVLGLDEEGREVLTYLEGESGPQGWAQVVGDAGLARFARLLRDYHDAVAGFRPPPESRWFGGTTGTGGSEVICHGDFGPWNVVWQGEQPVGILDWDYARPAPRLHDVCYALEYVAPFRDDAECLRSLRYPRPPHRRHRLEVFAGAYSLTSTSGLVDAVIDVQRTVLAQVRRLADAGHQPQAGWAADGHLEQLAGRLAWSRENRHLFE